MRTFGHIALFATATLTSCSLGEVPTESGSPSEREAFYPIVEVENRDVQAFRTYTASIQGVNNNDVRAKIQGYVSEVLVDEGQYVSKGQILFRLETNSLSESENAARSAISVAGGKVNAARIEVDKLIPLVDQNIVGNVLLETARANLQQAESELEQAKASYKSIVANVDYAAIRTPIDGVAGKVNFRTGALVGPNDQTPITTVSDVGNVYAYFSMNELDYINFLYETAGGSLGEKLKNMPMVDLILPNNKMYEEKGRIDAVTGQIDPQTGSVQFRASFPNKKRLLANGNSGTIRIPKIHENTLVIPETAIIEQQGKVFAYIVHNDTAKQTEIKEIARVNKLILVESGLKQGDTVVASGVGTLRTNKVIRVQNRK